jgi:uncharacterized protein with PIN domain
MMLGKLAQWMRILGYDVLYLNPVEDSDLIGVSRRESRILLTRDTRLIKRRGVEDYLLIQDNDPMKQLKEVIRVYPPERGRMLNRCIRCNTPLVDAVKKEIRNEIPDYIYHSQARFGRCPDCGRVFWQGSHYHHMLKVCREVTDKIG